MGTGLLIGGGAWVAGAMDPVQKAANESGEARLAAANTVYDWGEIPIDGGDVETTFEIKNEGSDILKLFNVVTSCTCTTAELQVGDKRSPVFGMHTKSPYIAEVPPGETAQLRVIYDPAFHGPQGVGVIERQVKVQTNDAAQPELVFNLSAVVSS